MKKISRGMLVFLIFVAVLLTSIGYSAFGNTLSITDIAASIRIDTDIRISNIVVSEVSTGVISSYEEYNKSSISTSVTLPNDDSYIIYDVDVTNYGNTLMGIKSIVNNNSNLKYELLDYIIGEEICDNLDKCTLGATKTIRIKVSYNNYDSSNLIQLLNLDFTFASYYNVIYDSITNNGYPSSVIDGSDLVINFTENLENLNVTMDGAVLILYTDYTYINNVLTIPNVSGNIKITNESGDIIADRYIAVNDSTTFDKITVTSLGKGVYKVNGSSANNVYVRLTDYFEAARSWASFNTMGIPEIMIPSTKTFNYKVTYISGSYTGISASNQFKITFREPNLTNIATIGYDFFSGYISPNTTSVDIGMLALYIKSGAKTFNDYTFKIEILEGTATMQEPEPIDVTNCASAPIPVEELIVSRCSDGLIDLTSTGPIVGSYYIFINNDYIKVGKNNAQLYDAALAANPKYRSGDTVSIVYQYYRGIPSLTQVESINFVMRDSSTAEALESPKVVNVIGGSTYMEDFVLTGTLTRDSMGVSIFLSRAITLNHYQFYLTDRKES